MKRTTLFADEEIMYRIKRIAEEEDKSAASVVREALVKYVSERSQGHPLLSLAGIGNSGRSDLSEKHEELLWRESQSGKRRRKVS